jgi:predicted RND superfamily exporter protein
LHKAEEWLFANPKIVLSLILLGTLVFASGLPRLRMFSNFADLLPQGHAYIKVYNRIKENFGGANTIILAVESVNGTIVSDEGLRLVNEATEGLDQVPSVNHNLLTSLTHRNSRKVYLAPDGSFLSHPYFDPQKKSRSAEELAQLRADIVANPTVYGILVSPDFKAAMVRAQLNEGDIDYPKTFAALLEVEKRLSVPGYRVHVTGNPVLTGWVYTYLHQILGILAATLALLASLLIFYFRRLYGIALPLLGIALSSIWGLGFMAYMGINLEPLSLPIPFLISARATSHGVQLVARYYEELAKTHSATRAARNALDALFRPGSLAIIVDALGIFVLVLGSAPFNTKLGLAAGFWGLSVIFTVHFMVPLALTVLPQPKRLENKNEGMRRLLSGVLGPVVGSVTGARWVLAVAAVGLLAGSWFVAHVRLGESEAGSPLLYPNHEYNQATRAINGLFPGADELYVVARTDKKEGIKRPEVMAAIEQFQARMLADPAVGGAKAISGVIRVVNRLIHNDDPRWMQLPDNEEEIGGLLFTYLASNPTPGALKEFISSDEDEASLVFYYKDHKAETVSRAAAMAERAGRELEASVPGLHFEVGGGSVGVTAAVNQALHADHMKIIPAVMLLAFVLVAIYYNSLHAGWLMVLPMLFSTVSTYAFMSLLGISISVNTVPVITVGVGVGIDYAVYFMDRIREELAAGKGDMRNAILRATAGTGSSVFFTAATLVAGVVMWIAMSDLRFQSDAAILLSFMLIVNAIAAMLIVPAWCAIFRPHFLVATHYDADHVLEEDEEEPEPGLGRRGAVV